MEQSELEELYEEAGGELKARAKAKPKGKSAFRAEVRRWFYEDHPLSVFPLVPMSAEPCA